MERFYEGDASHRYMLLPDTNGYRGHYAMQMLMENPMDGLLKIQMREIDNETVFRYDITDCCSIKEYCEDKEVDFLLLDALYMQILSTVEEGREYLLPDTHYLLSPDTIFLREEKDASWNVAAAYHIEQDKDLGCQLLAMTEFMMEHVNHKDKKAVQLVYGLYGMLREEGCSLQRLRTYINKCEEKSTEDSQEHILPKEFLAAQKETQEFAQDLEKVRVTNKWNATITVASALGMVAVIGGFASYGNLSLSSLMILAAGAIAAEVAICGLVLK